MQPFEDMKWVTTTHEEDYQGNTVAYYVVSDWKIPFTYESWALNLGFSTGGPATIYEHCAQKLTRTECKTLVEESATKLYMEPGMVEPFEKMASF